MKDLSFIGTPDFKFDRDVINDNNSNSWYTPRDLSGNVFVARNIIADKIGLSPKQLDFIPVFIQFEYNKKYKVLSSEQKGTLPYWKIFVSKNNTKKSNITNKEKKYSNAQLLDLLILDNPKINLPPDNPPRIPEKQLEPVAYTSQKNDIL